MSTVVWRDSPLSNLYHHGTWLQVSVLYNGLCTTAPAGTIRWNNVEI